MSSMYLKECCRNTFKKLVGWFMHLPQYKHQKIKHTELLFLTQLLLTKGHSPNGKISAVHVIIQHSFKRNTGG